MKSYIKIYGPPINKAIKALEKISVEISDVSIMNTNIFMKTQKVTHELAARLSATPLGTYAFMAELAVNHFSVSGIPLPEERRGNIISRSSESLGDYDFFFEWLKAPSFEQLYKLIEKIDEDLYQIGCNYTITTKK